MRKIIVPLDQSTLAERAVAVARSIAAETDASVRLVEVATSDEAESAARYLETTAEELLPDRDPELDVLEADVGESVAERLLRAIGPDAAETLVCMSTHGRSGIGSALLGSTAEDLMRRTTEPVLLVGRHVELPWPGDRHGLLVPVSGSMNVEDPFEAVAEVVHRSGLEPTLVRVAHPFDVEHAQHPMTSLEDAARRLAAFGVEAKLEHRYASNIPIALVGVARTTGAALILMASYVQPGAARTFVGSVTMRTVHEAPCPVLVYPRALIGDNS